MSNTRFGNLNVTKDANNTFTILSSVDGKPLLLNNNLQVGVVNAAGNTNAGISIKDRNDGTFRDIYVEEQNVKFKVDGSTTTSLIREDELTTIVNNSGDPLIFSNVHIDMKAGNGGLLNFFDSSVNSNSNAITAPVGIRRNTTNGKMQFRNESSNWIDIIGESFQLNINTLSSGQILKYNISNSKWENNNFDIISDTTPQLGGNLDTNSKHIEFANNYGFIDSSNNNKLLIFDDTNSSANFELLISKTLGGPKIAANGTDSNIDLDIHAKGNGDINIVVSGGSTIITKPQINDSSSNNKYIFGVSELAADSTVTLPLLTGDDEFVFKDHVVTLTNKTIDLTNNTLNGTLAEFNTALSGDDSFCSLTGSETLTNKGINLANNTLTGTLSEFNTALSGGDSFCTLAGSDTLTNKTLTSAVLNTGVSGSAIIDDDTFGTASSTTLATSESIKAYIDAKIQGLDIKESVRVATTASFTMESTASATTLVLANGEGGFDNSADTLTIDGISLSQNDRVLIKDGVNSASNGVHHKWNGIYTVGALDGTDLTLTRSTDLNEASEFNGGTFTFVEEGTVNASCGFVFSTSGSITIGTTALTFTQFSGAGLITAGTNLSKIGNTLNVDDTFLTNNADDTTTGTITAAGLNVENASTATMSIKSTNTSAGEAHLNLISDNATHPGDGFQIKSVNGVLTIASDHNSIGTYGETIMTLTGNDIDASRTTAITGNLDVSNGVDVTGNLTVSTDLDIEGDIDMATGKKIIWVDDTQYISGTDTGITIESDNTLAVNADTSVTFDSPIINFNAPSSGNAVLNIKSTNTSDGEANLNLISDNATHPGDGFQIKSVNGVLTIASDHNASGTYNETIMTLTGHDTDSSRTTAITGNLTVSGTLSVAGGLSVSFDNSTYSSVSSSSTIDLNLTNSTNYYIKTNTGLTSLAIVLSATTSGSMTGVSGQIIIENLTVNPSTISWTTNHGWYFESDSNGDTIIPTLTGVTGAIDIFNYLILVDSTTESSRKILVTKASHFQSHA